MSGEAQHGAPSILEQVPPDYYELGTRNNLFQRTWHGRKWRMLESLLTKDSSFRPSDILDVGCASGLTTSHLARWFPQARVVGLDAYQGAVAYGSQHHGDVRFVLADAHELPLARERFDLVTCVETLEHLGDPRKAVLEIRRCLRPGGTFILAQDTDSLLFKTVWWFWTKARGQVWDHAHVNPLNAAGLGALLEDVGFRILAKRYVFFGMEVFFKAAKVL